MAGGHADRLRRRKPEAAQSTAGRFRAAAMLSTFASALSMGGTDAGGSGGRRRMLSRALGIPEQHVESMGEKNLNRYGGVDSPDSPSVTTPRSKARKRWGKAVLMIR